ncbi:hypothetical protein SAMN04488540_104131 [Ferrimonas sediminum]|uniref:Uncharacterized protein n=1 Tax=Ferrimonas sediminum TaxID=718193 RepID=A0A1G8PYM7_9GAMM|nr:hypothetical protein [Ferrimonas sediminum]SDI97602.1 hypothetical protein SAMN04488540_104131 [Ferrimonas sediminum]
MSTYIHKTERRLRVRSEFILNHPEQVAELIEQLNEIDAVLGVTHKRYAGSVAIVFDHNEIDADSLLETVESHGWLRSQQRSAFVENAVKNGSKTLVKGVAMMALKRAIGPTVVRALAFA